MTSLAARRRAARHQAQFRYGAVFAVVLALVLFEVVAPAGAWARAVTIALAGAAVTVAIATGRARSEARHARAVGAGVLVLIAVIAAATDLLGTAGTFLIITFLVACIPVSIVGGLVRLIKEAGVTLQVVAGALTIYLVVGLLFASVISFAATVESGRYFKQGPGVTNGERVYFSFTTLTTTGYGDFTAARPFGHALAVLEMLTGQLYLVTVIGVVVGNFTARARTRNAADGSSRRTTEET